MAFVAVDVFHRRGVDQDPEDEDGALDQHEAEDEEDLKEGARSSVQFEMATRGKRELT